MSSKSQSITGGAVLVAISMLLTLCSGRPAHAVVTSTVPQITFHFELIAASAGDVAKSGVSFNYIPFAPAITGNIPIPGINPPQDEGSLAHAQVDGASQLRKYLEAHGRVVSKPNIEAASGMTADISISEPIQGPIGGGFSGYITYTNSLRLRIEVAPTAEPDSSIDYGLTLDMLGGKKQSGMTMIAEEKIKIEQKARSGEMVALGGLADSEYVAPAGVPLLTDGLTSAGGFGAADPKAPVLFIFVTATVGPATIP